VEAAAAEAAATFVAVAAAAAAAGVERFTTAAVVDGKATSASKIYLHHYELTAALSPEPWHGTQSGVFFGWQEGAVAGDSSRDTE
jgi:uncharacterized protein YbjT (DUF2867 family)